MLTQREANEQLPDESDRVAEDPKTVAGVQQMNLKEFQSTSKRKTVPKKNLINKTNPEGKVKSTISRRKIQRAEEKQRIPFG